MGDRNNLGGGGSGPPPQMGFIGYPTVPPLPHMPEPPTNKPFNYPPPHGGGGGGGNVVAPPYPYGGATPFNYNIPPGAPADNEHKDLNTQFINVSNNN